MKKKIVHIVEAFGGGVFSYLVDLVNETSAEFDITIIYALREQTPSNFEEYFNNDVKFIESKHLHREIDLVEEFRAIKEIKRYISDIKPDVVHLHSSKAGMIGRLAISNKKTHLFYTPHGFSFLMKNVSKLKRFFYWFLEKVATLRKTTIIGCSYGEYQEALKLTKNAININNGVNIDEIEREIRSEKIKKIDFNNLKICTIGRINYQKNPEMFNRIALNFPNNKFTWIGDGGLKDCLTSDNVEITGWKKRNEALKILNDADIFILTSLWEGLPIALLEAMYMGKICIVSNVTGNKDVIVNNKNGFIAYDEDDYVKIINSLQEQNINDIILSAKNDIVHQYNWRDNAQKYAALYKGEKIK